MSRRRMSIVDATSFIASSLIVLTPTTKGSVAIGLASVSSDFPDHCIEDSNSKAYPIGSRWNPPNSCSMAECMKRGNTMYVSYQSCGFVEAEPPCTTVSNLTASYPACCPRVVCQQPNINDNIINDNEINIDDYGLYDDQLYMMSSDNHAQYLPINDYPDISEFQQRAPLTRNGRQQQLSGSNSNYNRNNGGSRTYAAAAPLSSLFPSASSSVHEDIYQAAESVAVNSRLSSSAANANNRPAAASNGGSSVNQLVYPYTLEDNRPRFYAKLPSVLYADDYEPENVARSRSADAQASSSRLSFESRQVGEEDYEEYDWDRIFAGTSLA